MSTATLASLLGGRPVLGRRISSEADLIDAVREGLPFAALSHLLTEFEETALSRTEIFSLIGSHRTLQRKQTAHARLTPAESDRVARVARLMVLAEQALGDAARARLWLTEANAALGGQRPFDLLQTDLGTEQVEHVLGRIEYGVYE